MGHRRGRRDRSTWTGEGVTVAVLDTGIDSKHPAFAGVDIVEKDFTGTGNGDRQGHGTHCAGTIFGRDVDGKRIGVARGVKRALIGKVLGDEGGGDSEHDLRRHPVGDAAGCGGDLDVARLRFSRGW